MNLTFKESDKNDLTWSKIQVEILIRQYRSISSRLWHITLLLLVEAVGFIGAIIIILIDKL